MSTYGLQTDKSVGSEATEVDPPDAVPVDVPLRVGDDGTTWAEATDTFVSGLGIEGADSLTGMADTGVTEQFTPSWSEQTWAELLARNRAYLRWAECTVLLTFTGRTRLPGASDFLPPVTHFERISESRQASRTALSRCLHDVDMWRSVTVVGAHQTGHLHLHTGLWIDQPVHRERFEGVIGAHVENCQLASSDAHGSGAIRVRTVGDNGDLRGLVAELGKNAPGLDTRADREHGVLSDPAHKVYAAAVIEAGDWRSVRF